jgi:uncharacterized protein involved in outer membrane biogenesis
MKRIAFVVLAIVAVAAIALGALIVFPPKEWVKSVLAEKIKKATGRELVIKGATSVRLLPTVVLRVEDVELREPTGAPGEPLFFAKAVLIEAQPWQLISGSAIERVSLDEPRLALSSSTQAPPQGTGQPITIRAVAITGGTLTYKDTRATEILQMAAVEGTVKDLVGTNVAELAFRAGETTIRGTASGPAVLLKALDASAKTLAREGAGEIALKAGQLRYGEGASAIELEAPQATAKSVSWSGALDAAVGFVWNKEPITANVRVQSPSALVDGKPSPVVARLATPKGSLDLDVSLAVLDGAAKIDGKTNAAAASLRDLAAWAGVQMPKTGVFGAARVEGDVKLEGKRIAFDKVQVVLDATKATGSLALDFGGPRPVLSGQLSADAVDVDSYFEAAPPPAKKARVRELPPASPPVLPPGSEKEALKGALRAQLTALEASPEASAPSPGQDRTRGLAVGNEWSDDPIDLSGLNTIDADLIVSVAKLTIREFEIGVPDLKAALKGGVLSLDAKDIAVEGARITGTASVDAREARPKLATKFKAHGVDPKAWFEVVGQEARIVGKSSVEADLSGSGNSARKLIETLSGRVKAATSKGAIVGYDLTNVWGGIVAIFSGYDPRSRTPFDELEADLALTDGVTSKSTVEITGPIVGVNGSGVVRLPSREIDYKAQLSLLSLGQSAAVRILGGWLQPKVNVTNWGALASSRGPQADPLEPLKGADLKDPELARLATEVLKKGASQGTLSPQVTEALQEVKARAEGRK